MSRCSAFVRTSISALALGTLSVQAPARAGGPEAGEDKIVVRVGGLRNNTGSVRCSLYDSAEGFPIGQKHVIARARVLPSEKSATCSFARPASGKSYAVVIHHDENDDGAFQRNALGIPLEGYGFSNNVVPVLSAPSFESCKFTYSGGTSSLGIAARY